MGLKEFWIWKGCIFTMAKYDGDERGEFFNMEAPVFDKYGRFRMNQ